MNSIARGARPMKTVTFFGLIVLELMIAILGRATGVNYRAHQLETVLMW